MDIEFLFSSFPFISEEKVMLSQMYITDEECLEEILQMNEIEQSAEGYINTAEYNFKNKRSVELGYYRKDKPNYLLGTLTISHIDTKIKSVDLEITPSYNDIEAAELAIMALTQFLFHHIKANKITCKKIDASAIWQGIMMNSGLMLEGCIRRAVLLAGRDTCSDVHIYGIIKEDLLKNSEIIDEEQEELDELYIEEEIDTKEQSEEDITEKEPKIIQYENETVIRN